MSIWRSKELRFGADHPSAAGHFPGNPIVPGGLLLDRVVAAVGAAAGAGPNVIRATKFLRPVRPGETLRLRWQSLGPGTIRFECRLAEAEDLAMTGTIEMGSFESGAAS